MSGFELLFPFLAGSGAGAAATGAAVGSTMGATSLAGISAASAGAIGGAASAALGTGGLLGGAGAAGLTAGGAAGGSIMSSIPMLLMGGKSLLEGYGQYQANKANAGIAGVQAKQARLNAAYNERRQREISARVMGEQAARFGASGVAMEGTPLLVMADQAREAELEALAIRNEGKQASEGYLSEARQYRKAATNSLMGGLIEASAYGGAAYLRRKGIY